jgi:hypothetical protein
MRPITSDVARDVPASTGGPDIGRGREGDGNHALWVGRFRSLGRSRGSGAGGMQAERLLGGLV